jgi:hypothetical protein
MYIPCILIGLQYKKKEEENEKNTVKKFRIVYEIEN